LACNVPGLYDASVCSDTFRRAEVFSPKKILYFSAPPSGSLALQVNVGVNETLVAPPTGLGADGLLGALFFLSSAIPTTF